MWPSKKKTKTTLIVVEIPLPDIQAYGKWKDVRHGIYNKGGTVQILMHEIEVSLIVEMLLMAKRRGDCNGVIVYHCPFIAKDVHILFTEAKKYIPGIVIWFEEVLNDIPFQCYISPYGSDIFEDDNGKYKTLEEAANHVWSKKLLITPATVQNYSWPSMHNYQNELREILEGRGGLPKK